MSAHMRVLDGYDEPMLQDPVPGPRRVEERLDPAVPALVYAEWVESFPWVVQGTTTRDADGRSMDLGLFSGGSPAAEVRARWLRLIEATGMASAVHARQVHGSEVRVHADPRPGLRLVPDCDGHVTRRPGVLLAVSVADCVSVFVLDPDERAVAVLHAGWRGIAAGVLERGLERLGAPGAAAGRLHVHLGPSICDACYEVGPEVFAALGLPEPAAAGPLDLRGVLAERAVAAGVDPARVTISEHCTRCTGSGLFSHRGGDRGRQVGYLGIRP